MGLEVLALNFWCYPLDGGDWGLALRGGKARTRDGDLGVLHITWDVFNGGNS